MKSCRKNLQNRWLFLIILLALIGLPNILSADNQNLEYQNLVEIKAKFQPEAIRVGEKFRLVLDLRFKPGWHIYSVIPSEDEDAPPPTDLTVTSETILADGPVYETRPTRSFIKELGFVLSYHEDRASLYQNFDLSGEPPAGHYSARIKLVYQPCTDLICLPNRSQEVDITFSIVPGDAREKYSIANRSVGQLPDKKETGSLTGLTASGFWAFISFAALMGLISPFTPCVFPMIPITISYFSKQADEKQSRVIKLSLLFMVGIIATYTGLGLILSAIFGAGSVLQLASNPFVNLGIAAIFIIFALSLIGIFQISIPIGLQSYFDKKSRSLGGASGVILMGFTFTLTAFTCTVQFVGAMLIAAAHGEWMWPLVGMLVFSTVFAFPFFLLAVAPTLVKKIQGKSGDWMGRSKVVLGILELIASVKFLSNADLVWQLDLLSRNTALLIWIGLLSLNVLYLIWTGVRPKINKSVFQWGFVALFAALVIVTSRGFNDHSLGSLIDALLPPPAKSHVESAGFVSESESKQLKWHDSLKDAQIAAVSANKPIFLEFTGYTCVNCRWMEQNIFPRKAIHQQLADNYILARLFTDGGKSASKNLQLQIDRFQTVALPYYVILSPQGEMQRVFSGISLKPTDFFNFLSPSSQN